MGTEWGDGTRCGRVGLQNRAGTTVPTTAGIRRPTRPHRVPSPHSVPISMLAIGLSNRLSTAQKVVHRLCADTTPLLGLDKSRFESGTPPGVVGAAYARAGFVWAGICVAIRSASVGLGGSGTVLWLCRLVVGCLAGTHAWGFRITPIPYCVYGFWGLSRRTDALTNPKNR